MVESCGGEAASSLSTLNPSSSLQVACAAQCHDLVSLLMLDLTQKHVSDDQVACTQELKKRVAITCSALPPREGATIAAANLPDLYQMSKTRKASESITGPHLAPLAGRRADARPGWRARACSAAGLLRQDWRRASPLPSAAVGRGRRVPVCGRRRVGVRRVPGGLTGRVPVGERRRRGVVRLPGGLGGGDVGRRRERRRGRRQLQSLASRPHSAKQHVPPCFERP